MSLAPIYDAGDPRLRERLERGGSGDRALRDSVARLVEEVRDRGADAVREAVRRFDAPSIESLLVTPDEIEQAEVSEGDLEAIHASIERVREFHDLQLDALTQGWEDLDVGWAWRTAAVGDDEESGFIGQRLLPLGRVGVYAPGGKAAYPSSVIMNAVPALAAGVQDVVLATPPGKDGRIPDAVLVAARQLGISEILKAGGASAIASLALGIDGLKRVDKIAGPGNRYVNEAKRQLWGEVGIDGYAGPSEVAVFALSDADPHSAAADLLTQIEHSEDNAGFLVTLSRDQADAILAAAEEILEGAERREVMRQSLASKGAVIIAADHEQAVRAINEIAPEHLAIVGEEANAVLTEITNAGCVALGEWTPQSAGDYATGPSHTLPTGGAARYGSPVNVLDFLKVQSISNLTDTGLGDLAPTIAAFGQMEGLPLHGAAAQMRLQEDDQ